MVSARHSDEDPILKEIDTSCMHDHIMIYDTNNGLFLENGVLMR